ncbi:Egg cell-secreted protein like [Actinidia chinensis var. chinensis]|uniref:Egg cell-secreted protein like n=1 Tax=Actinidia chinensis var. chinensis TaxID=1590841 RepID=A0A2R6RDP1_ACTCC|nr:Egg cell-secreted protein like [Actinidia chinensis var. chinensis]
MAHSLKLRTIPLALWLTTMAVATARAPPDPILTLAARLKIDEGEDGSSKCWDSLLQLQSCTGEVVLFFLNGETYLGPSCCSAIRTIESQCWPSMLGSLGFTTEEGGILRGYCDATASTPPHRVAANVDVIDYRDLDP